MDVPELLAMRVSCAAHSRTWATEPGAEVSWSLYIVWMESITHTAGCSAAMVAEIFSSWISAMHPHLRAVEPEAARAQRHLRARFLAGDVQRAAPACDRVSSACSSSVDLPMPGSPPISTTPPATMPPPSTRSSSSMPVGWRSTSVASISESVVTGCAAASDW